MSPKGSDFLGLLFSSTYQDAKKIPVMSRIHFFLQFCENPASSATAAPVPFVSSLEHNRPRRTETPQPADAPSVSSQVHDWPPGHKARQPTAAPFLAVRRKPGCGAIRHRNRPPNHPSVVRQSDGDCAQDRVPTEFDQTFFSTFKYISSTSYLNI